MPGEIKAKDLNTKKFINDRIREIRDTVGDGIAINALRVESIHLR